MSKCEQITAEVLQADIVIVGCGAGGMSAAIAAKKAGAGRVVVLEKLHVTGGNAIFPPLPLADDDGVPRFACMDDNRVRPGDPRLSPDPKVRADANFTCAMEWNHWRGDARLIRTLADKFETNSDWLKSIMAPEDFIPSPEDMRGKLARVLVQACKNAGVEIYCDTPVKQIIKDEIGQVTGVFAEDKDGKRLEVTGKRVIISTGGFIGSKELMERYFHSYDENIYDEICYMGLKHTGDGIKMALEAGAASDGTVAFEWEMNRMPWLRNPASPLTNLLNNDMNPGVIWVTPQGERFADESKMNATNSIYRLKNKTFYILFDQGQKDKILTEGPDFDLLPEMLRGVDLFGGVEPEIKTQLAEGRMKIADTWDEIAEWMGADPAVLKATIEEYNSFCDQGHDAMFVKRPNVLTAFRTGPYYAAKSTLAMLVTRGPLKVNTKMQLLDKKDEPIPGLYAAGVDIGGTDSDTYACSAACHSIGWSLASGRIAGENAAKGGGR
ncbi:MAG: Succinate dehydrogenase/fumarate reductase, flavoprotein subunit [Firmicutes bacterium]|nr:Succinate dehydrogenase/fumarate reductase, flavoprotein subunit [Bacillota bacterium]